MFWGHKDMGTNYQHNKLKTGQLTPLTCFGDTEHGDKLSTHPVPLYFGIYHCILKNLYSEIINICNTFVN